MGCANGRKHISTDHVDVKLEDGIASVNTELEALRAENAALKTENAELKSFSGPMPSDEGMQPLGTQVSAEL